MIFRNKCLILVIFLMLPAVLFGSKNKVSFETLPLSSSNVYCFDITEDCHIYYCNGEKIICYNSINNEIVKNTDVNVSSIVSSIKKLSSKNLILLGTKSGELLVYSLDKGELIYKANYQSGGVNALAISSNENFIFSGCENGMIYKHSIEDLNSFQEFYEHNGPITSIDISTAKNLMAISSGDGSISIHNEISFEWIAKLSTKHKWVRDISFNDEKNWLISVGDDGKSYNWSLKNIDHIKVINSSRVSGNWLLTVDTGYEGKVICWGGLDHTLRIQNPFGTFSQKFKGPIFQTSLLKCRGIDIVVVCCILETGIIITQAKDMSFKSIYN